MGFSTTRERLGCRVRLDTGLVVDVMDVMDVMDGRHDPLSGHVDEPDPMATPIAFDRDPPRTRAELHLLAEALVEIEHSESGRSSALRTPAPEPTAREREVDEPKVDVCPVCSSRGRQHCSTRSGGDYKARALGWPTARRPTP